MKKSIAIIGLFICHSVLGQHFSISADRNNVLYIGVDNPISIAVENFPSEQIGVKANKGDIQGTGKRYVYRGDEPGNIWIILYNKATLEEIGRSSFRLNYIPSPVPYVGPSGGGNIQAVVLKSQKYIRAQLENFDFEVSYNINSFTLNVIRTDTCFFKEIKGVGNLLSNEVLEALSIIRKNDIVIFKNIYANGPDRRSLLLTPILFTITD